MSKTTIKSSFYVVGTGYEYSIKSNSPGPVPSALSGEYSSKGDAEKAIQLFHEGVRAKQDRHTSQLRRYRKKAKHG